MSKPLTKKIIAGKYKGKSIKLPSKTTTRSSKAIVLESFFNTIQFDIIDSIFVEVFAGSGSVGLEALSRGAKKVIFMEKDKDVIKTLKQNISQTNPNACEVIQGDSFANIEIAKKYINDKTYIYIDPPFSIREGMGDIYDKTIKLIENFSQHHIKLIVIEHMSKLLLPENIGKFKLTKTKKFGKTTLSYLELE